MSIKTLICNKIQYALKVNVEIKFEFEKIWLHGNYVLVLICNENSKEKFDT